MRYLRVIPALLALGAASPALAVDIPFTGTINGLCALGINTNGSLGLDTNGDLTSDLPVGVPAVLTIISVGTNKVTIDPPTWVTPAPGYVATGETRFVSYAGLGGLALVSQPYIATSTNFITNTLPLTLVTVNAKVKNPNTGFVSGPYSMKVTVTCAPP